jgi:putative oxygen-independent coproporphyrinogen III oxidase
MERRQGRALSDELRATSDELGATRRRSFGAGCSSFMVPSSSLGLYLHIPFCAHICNYCNFNRGLFDERLKREYVDALVQEIRASGDGAAADTIFFGGGTPSLLDAEDVAQLIAACRNAFDVAPDAEVTLEANPETVSVAKVAGYRAAGANRISLGVQSLHDSELQRLDRQHTAARARQALSDVRAAGIDNVSLDLMLWLPQQRLEEWQATIDGLIDLKPNHASLYLLELYPNAPLKETMARERWSLAPDDDAAEMYLWAMERLEGAGYLQYEISNVARGGQVARHNLKYWQDGSWLGFGCGAHSTREAWRWANLAGTRDYVTRVTNGASPADNRRERSDQERLEDALFTGLRLTEGIDLDDVSGRYGVDAWGEYGDALRLHESAGRLKIEGHRVRLTRSGMLVANDVMTVFI